jgi:hypothetical protein
MPKPNRVIYTCVTGNYDRVYPPVTTSGDVQFIMLTDDDTLSVPGWNVKVISPSKDLSPSLQNRHCKIFPWKYIQDTDESIYVDGNVRILSDLSGIFSHLDGHHDVVLLRHPKREFVHEEIESCVQLKKVNDRTSLDNEYAELIKRGFIDHGMLTENNVIIRSHNSMAAKEAMQIWWEFVTKYSGRDQISLHYALSASAAKVKILPVNAKKTNPYFDIYPHMGTKKTYLERKIVHLSARKSEGVFWCILHKTLKKLYKKIKQF